MKLNLPFVTALSFAALAISTVGAAHADRTTPIVWTDLDGRGYGPNNLRAASATTFIFFSTECLVSNAYMSRIREAEKDYFSKGVRFFLVNVHQPDTTAKIRTYLADRKVMIPVVKDSGFVLTDRLAAKMTPEAVVVGREGDVKYRGRIDDNKEASLASRSYLRDALDATLAGKPAPIPQTKAEGCVILRPTSGTRAAAKFTYSRDIAPILTRNCVSCHRPGEVAPFSLVEYKDAKLWAPMLKDVTRRKIMPPWKAKAGYGDFHDARVLSDKEIAMLSEWADFGAPQGASVQSARLATTSTSGWSGDVPDVVLRPKAPYHLAAEGKDVYRCFVLPVEFKDTTWVTICKCKPQNRAVVHHVIVYVDTKGESTTVASGAEEGFDNPNPGAGPPVPNAAMIGGWAPGASDRPLPEGVAIPIAKGSKLVMEVHYHRSGRAETDQTEIGLTFARKPVTKIPGGGIVIQPNLPIEAGNGHVEVKSNLYLAEKGNGASLQEDMTLFSVTPHMHQIGKEMRVTAILPDGKIRDLIWIEDWDFNWQSSYDYREPIKLPKGTKFQLSAVYDNSEQNPRNPNRPPKAIHWGEATSDEMCIAFLTMTKDAEHLSIQPKPYQETVVR